MKKHMKHLMGKVLLCTCLCICTMAMPICASSEALDEEGPLLSPGIRVIAAKTVMHKNGLAGDTLCFSQQDFSKVLGYTPTAVTIRSLPDHTVGVLKLGTLTISPGQSIAAAALSGLRFVPADGAGVAEASFTYTAQGSAYTTETALSCLLHFHSAPNEAPSARALSVTTYADVGIERTLCAADPEGDMLTYTLIRDPKKGTVAIDEATGRFLYTPSEGKRGEDVFTYVVRDKWGNESEICRVMVTIRDGEAYKYDDLAGHICEADAMRLAEENILAGVVLGEKHVFSPDAAVSKGEFLVMAMRAAGYACDGDSTSLSVFADADTVPAYMRSYAACAYEEGILSGGYDTDGERVLNLGEPIKGMDASVLLCRLFDIGVPEILPVFSENTVGVIPSWSEGAVYAVRAAGILDEVQLDHPLDRADTARILSSAMDHQE